MCVAPDLEVACLNILSLIARGCALSHQPQPAPAPSVYRTHSCSSPLSTRSNCPSRRPDAPSTHARSAERGKWTRTRIALLSDVTTVSWIHCVGTACEVEPVVTSVCSAVCPRSSPTFLLVLVHLERTRRQYSFVTCASRGRTLGTHLSKLVYVGHASTPRLMRGSRPME
ncbi:uncharacterized protein CC84DRAFT_350235 [Paraphaeosphaeria sporulosa]|uniref:Uncharacterized protein n=1 Tax=Paraphaeosphaeria sporulosa TaxID=1460663 RepID=A0A177BXA8_9PLEO|nr:uncharacterized protein CC84DRAFT_350235 [Paraphaeosphaeria sporulosa]OAF99944.1 hypothetical protein CC84DRAFT_350235 [Paraphaeosphaeria sporulosa]